MEITVRIQDVTDTLRRQVAMDLAFAEEWSDALQPATDDQIAEWARGQVDNGLDNLHDTYGSA